MRASGAPAPQVRFMDLRSPEDSMADTKQRDQTKPQTRTTRAVADEFDQDLHPNPMAGQNISAEGEHPEQFGRTAKDVKQLHARYREWSDADLAQVPILPDGSRLEQGATYMDLAGDAAEFTATGDISVQPGQCVVAKTAVPYQVWNRLLGIQNVARTGVAQ
jgi:hypothetical protein